MTINRLSSIIFGCWLVGNTVTHYVYAEEYVPKSEFDALEKRVELLEKAVSTPIPTTKATSSDRSSGTTMPGHWVMDAPDQRIENWQAIKSGMKPEQVKALLGSPSQVFKINWENIWYYQTNRGNGSVVFNNTGSVSQVQIPPL